MIFIITDLVKNPQAHYYISVVLVVPEQYICKEYQNEGSLLNGPYLKNNHTLS